MDKNVIVIDLDGTITIDDKELGYEHKPENPAIIQALKNAKSYGYDITIMTSRNMRTYQGDVNKIKQFTQPVIEDWLKIKDVPYDQLVVGKPWCGPSGYYVDDKNLHLDEFIFKFGSAYANQKVGLVLLDATNLGSSHWHKLFRLFDVTSITVLNEVPLAKYSSIEGVNVNYCSTLPELHSHLKNDKNTFFMVVSEKMDMDLYSVFFASLSKLNVIDKPYYLKVNFYRFLEEKASCELDRCRFVSLISKKSALHLLDNTNSHAALIEKHHEIKFDLTLPYIESN